MLRKYKIFVLFGLILLASCASFNISLSQHTLDEVDKELIGYLSKNPLDYKSISLSPLFPEAPVIPIKLAVVLESSSALRKFSSAEDFFYNANIVLLQKYFSEIKPIGIVDNKQTVQAAIQRLLDSKEVDAVLILSDMMPGFSGTYENMYRRMEFHYSLKSLNEDKDEYLALAGFQGEKNNLAPEAQKQLLTKLLINSARELEKILFEQRAEAMHKKAQLAEEERRRKELLARLQTKREQFLAYGFDVIDFVDFAKSTLKVKGGVDFGGAVPEIDFRTFKNRNYVEIKIGYLVTYNTLKVSMYDAASITFDEVVKKLAKKISMDFKKQDTLDGFIFNVTYTNKDFSEKYDVPRHVTNEFILPKEACRQYANLDITNQDLINQSIVLVDGERISLNLQISK